MNITELMAELQAGEVARAKVPELEKRLAEIGNTLADRERHNQGLEENIVRYKAEIAQLKSDLSKTGNDRDNALLAQMEAEEKLNSFRKVVVQITGDIKSSVTSLYAMDDSLNPPAPVPPVAQVEEPKAELIPADYVDAPKAVQVPITEGQSEASPTHSPAPTENVNTQANQSPPAPTTTVENKNTASTGSIAETYRPFSPPEAPKPYTDKPYYMKPENMTWREWTSGGGEMAYWTDNLDRTN